MGHDETSDRPTPPSTRVTQVAIIKSFAPEPYEVVKPLFLDVRPQRGEVVASFLAADLTARATDEAEAVAKLKDLILDVFEHLASKPPGRLDAAGVRQLAVLREHIRKTTPV